jgi:hypothetical protein
MYIGNSADWAKSIGIKYVYIVELPIRGFVLPASFILPVSKDFFPALDVLASKISTLNVWFVSAELWFQDIFFIIHVAHSSIRPVLLVVLFSLDSVLFRLIFSLCDKIQV